MKERGEEFLGSLQSRLAENGSFYNLCNEFFEGDLEILLLR